MLLVVKKTLMIETSGEGGSAWLTPPLGEINSSLKERELLVVKYRVVTIPTLL